MRKTDTAEMLGIHLNHLFEKKVNFKERVILINGEITEETFAFVDAALTELESHSRQAVTIKIHSMGGCVTSALGIVGRLKNSTCKIITIGYGIIASAATLILACGSERRASSFMQFMYHESSYVLEGRHSANKAAVENSEREEQLWAQWMAHFSKKTKKFYYEESKFTDKYWSPEQLKEFGVIDKII